MAIELGHVSVREPKVEKRVSIEVSRDVVSLDYDASVFWSVDLAPSDEQTRVIHATIQSKGLLAARKVSDRIRFHPVGSNDVRLPSKELAISGHIVEDIGSYPNEIQLGRHELGQVVQEAIQLRSLTKRGFSVKLIRTSESSLEVTPATDHESHTYLVRVRVASRGDTHHCVTFGVTECDGRTCELIVPIRYFGVDMSAGANNP
jgi:hypothetical protein